jgi:hypothetical protein
MTNSNEKYSKTVEHLDKLELYLICKRYRNFVPRGMSKENVLVMLVESIPDLLSNKMRCFYFKRDPTGQVLLIKNKVDDPENEHVPVQVPAHLMNNVDSLNAEHERNKADNDDQSAIDPTEFLDAQDNEAHQEQPKQSPQSAEHDKLNLDHEFSRQLPRLDTTSNQRYRHASDFAVESSCIPSSVENADLPYTVNRLEKIAQAMENKSSHGSYKFQQKLKFDENLGAEAFLVAVENFAKANKIHDTATWIQYAKAGLMNSQVGLSAQATLEPEDETNWVLFKKKIISTIGFDRAYYKAKFRSFRRQSGERIGIAFAKLTQAYRRAYDKPGLLSSNDREHICTTFIQGLEGSLRTALEMEESRLSFSNIVDRASTIERALGFPSSTNPFEVMAISRQAPMPTATPVKDDKMDNLLSMMMKMMEQNSNQMTSLMKSLTENKPQKTSGGNRSKYFEQNVADAKKANGYCLQMLRKGECKRTECNWNHQPAPESVTMHFSKTQ